MESHKSSEFKVKHLTFQVPVYFCLLTMWSLTLWASASYFAYLSASVKRHLVKSFFSIFKSGSCSLPNHHHLSPDFCSSPQMLASPPLCSLLFQYIFHTDNSHFFSPKCNSNHSIFYAPIPQRYITALRRNARTLSMACNGLMVQSLLTSLVVLFASPSPPTHTNPVFQPH